MGARSTFLTKATQTVLEVKNLKGRETFGHQNGATAGTREAKK